MSSWADRQGEDGEEEEEGVEDEFRSTEDHVLFLIDARPAMFTLSDSGEAFIVNSLRVAQNVMKTKIVASDRSSVGVILFGAQARENTEAAAASTSHPQVVPLFPLGVPSAQRLKKIEALLRDPAGAGLEGELVAQAAAAEGGQPCPLREALWACAQAFHAVGAKGSSRGDSKRLWVFTNDDQPNKHDSAEQARTVQVGRDCAETGIEISLWHLPLPGGAAFSTDLFFAELLLSEREYKRWRQSRGAEPFSDSFPEQDRDGDEDALALSDRIQAAGRAGFDAAEYRMRRREHRKRRLGTLRLQLGAGDSGGAISMGMYKLLHPATRPQYTWLQAHSNLPTKSVSIYMDNTTAAVLDETQITTYIEFNGRRIPMTADDMKAIKSSQLAHSGAEAAADAAAGAPFIRLLYCIPRAALTADMQLKDATFLFPDDSTIAGSMSLFRCLLRQLVDKGLVGVGHMLRTAGGEARLVALLPCDEKTDAEGFMEQPGGLYALPLPFIQDVRNVLDGAVAAAPPDPAVAAAIELVSAMQFAPSFRYTDLESPGIQFFYSMLQAVALNDEQCEWRADRDDMLMPDPESLRVHAPAIAAFGAATGLGDDADDSAPKTKAARKRPAASDGLDGPAAQRQKSGGGLDTAQLEGLSAAELKEACRARGLPVSGTKAVLVQRLRDHT